MWLYELCWGFGPAGASHGLDTLLVFFAATGDPGWARYEPHGRATHGYDTTSAVLRYPEERSRELWRDQRFGVMDVP